MRHGFLLIDKPAGPTSHDIVSQVRRGLPERDIGHLGTLDPAATGLLVLAIGSKALKVIEYFGDLHKEYEADVLFGAVSSTYDREGTIEKVTPKAGWTIPDELTVRRLIEDKFLGSIEQTPPIHSAIHVGGQRAYDIARQGKSVNMPTRVVEITACEILSFEFPKLKLRVACSSGTYIRSLAHDLGELMRCGSYLEGLRRTKVGKWDVADAVTPEKAAWGNVIPLKDILKDFISIEITDAELIDLSHGRNIKHEIKPNTLAWHAGLPVAILQPAKDGSRMAHPKKVL